MGGSTVRGYTCSELTQAMGYGVMVQNEPQKPMGYQGLCIYGLSEVWVMSRFRMYFKTCLKWSQGRFCYILLNALAVSVY